MFAYVLACGKICCLKYNFAKQGLGIVDGHDGADRPCLLSLVPERPGSRVAVKVGRTWIELSNDGEKCVFCVYVIRTAEHPTEQGLPVRCLPSMVTSLGGL